MKPIRIFLIAAFITLIFAPIAFAQDGGDIPQTAVDALNLLSVFLATVGGLVAGAVTDWIKSRPWLSDPQKTEISGHAAKLIASVVSAGTGLLIAFLMPYAIELDVSGGYAVVLAFLTLLMNKGIFEVEGVRRAIALR